MQNMAHAAKAQGQQAWWDSVLQDPDQLSQVRASYEARCPAKQTGKREPFLIAQYKEDVRQEDQILTDGVYEMMHLKAYQYFTQTQKNGGIDPEARVLCLGMCL